MEYREKNILAIKFGSYLKIITSGFFSLGVLFGILSAIVAFFGGPATFSIGETVITGPKAVIPLLLFFPIGFGLFGLLWGIFMFLPFKFFIKLNKGMKLRIVEEKTETH